MGAFVLRFPNGEVARPVVRRRGQEVPVPQRGGVNLLQRVGRCPALHVETLGQDTAGAYLRMVGVAVPRVVDRPTAAPHILDRGEQQKAVWPVILYVSGQP